MFRVARQNYREGTQVTTAGLAFLAYQNLLTNDPLTKKEVSYRRNCPSCSTSLEITVEGSSVDLSVATNNDQPSVSNILPSQLEGVVSDNIEQDPSEDIEDSENEGLIDEEFYNDDSNVTEDDLNALQDLHSWRTRIYSPTTP